MNMEERLQTVVTQAETDGTKWHTIIHGDSTTTVSTENGNVPSIAKQLADVRNEVINGVADYLGSCQTARDTALQAKADALVIKGQTETLKDETQILRNEAENFKNLSQSTFNSISGATNTAIASVQTEEQHKLLLSKVRWLNKWLRQPQKLIEPNKQQIAKPRKHYPILLRLQRLFR